LLQCRRVLGLGGALVQAKDSDGVAQALDSFVASAGTSKGKRSRALRDHDEPACARFFSLRHGDSYQFKPGVTSSVDYKQEYQRPGKKELSIGSVIGIHEVHDLALVRVDKDKCPPPLRLAVAEPQTPGYNVAVIGYPAQDPRNDMTEELRIFRSIFNVKRLQPGTLTGLTQILGVDVVLHDCSTLGGNSGSAVFDFLQDRVVALHFGGDYKETNRPVPLWKLTQDPLLKQAGVSFG
jgi:hypothetical protein